MLVETGIPISARGCWRWRWRGCFDPTCCCEKQTPFLTDPVSERNAIRGRKQIEVVCRKMPASFIPPRSETRHITGFLFRRGHAGHAITLLPARSHRQAARSQRPPSALIPASVAIQPIQPPAVPVQQTACPLPFPEYHHRFVATARRDTSPIPERASDRP